MTLCRGKGRVFVFFLTLLISIAILVWLFLLAPPIAIQWQTETEVDTVAFNVLRAEEGASDFQAVNAQPIPAEGSAVAGADYSFTDKAAQRGHTYNYRLQELTSQGEKITYPWQTSARSQRSWLDVVTTSLILLVLWGWWLFGCRKRVEPDQTLTEA